MLGPKFIPPHLSHGGVGGGAQGYDSLLGKTWHYGASTDVADGEDGCPGGGLGLLSSFTESLHSQV